MATKPLFGITPETINDDYIEDMYYNYNVPSMPYKRMRLLAILYRINGIRNKNEQGEFYLTNKALLDMSDYKSEEKMIDALREFVELGLITRERRDNCKPTYYSVRLERKRSVEDRNDEKGSLKKGSENNSMIP